jgi:hypothetical protein
VCRTGAGRTSAKRIYSRKFEVASASDFPQRASADGTNDTNGEQNAIKSYRRLHKYVSSGCDLLRLWYPRISCPRSRSDSDASPRGDLAETWRSPSSATGRSAYAHGNRPRALGTGRAGGKARGSRRARTESRLPRCVYRADAASRLPFVVLVVPRQREQIAQGARLAMLALRQGSAAFHERRGLQFLFDSRL